MNKIAVDAIRDRLSYLRDNRARFNALLRIQPDARDGNGRPITQVIADHSRHIKSLEEALSDLNEPFYR